MKKGYKLTDIGIIPQEWEVKELGNVCQIFGRIGFRGYTVNDIVGKEQGAITISPSNIKDNKIDFTECTYISWFKYEESPEIKIFNGDILLVKTGSTYGKTAIVKGLKEKATVNPQLIVLKKILINNDFLGYIMSFNIVQNQISSTIVGGAIPTLAQEQIKKFQIPLPPSVSEQKAIAQALSDTDALITALEALIDKKRLIKQGTMQQLLTGKRRLEGFSEKWEVKKLGDIGECIIGLTYKPENIKESGLLVLRSSNIKDNLLKFDDNVFVDIDVSEKLRIKIGDILICVRNGSRDLIGKSALMDKRVENQTFGAFMSVFRTENYEFVFHLFQSDILKRQIKDNLGATINQITNKDLNSFEIPYPSVSEQKAIAAILSDMDAEIAQLEAKRDKYKQVKQGMMQELLTGKTRLI